MSWLELDEMASPADARVAWHRARTPDGRVIEWQTIAARSGGGRRLLVVEIDAESETRVIDAVAVLIGREKPQAV